MSSSDYWGDEDPEFLAFINQIVLPGDDVHHTPKSDAVPRDANTVPEDNPQPSRNLKRPRSPDPEESQSRSILPLVTDDKKDSNYLKSDAYGASSFGGFSQYMQRKRAKLQIQNAEMDVDEDRGPLKSHLFKGLQIYVCINPSSSLCIPKLF